MHSLLKGTVVLAALVAAAPAFAQMAAPGYGYDYGYDNGYGPAPYPGYGPGPGYDNDYGPGQAYPQGPAAPVYEGRSVAAEPSDNSGGGAAYCEQRFRSYDPGSGTYLGYDGQRHPCP